MTTSQPLVLLLVLILSAGSASAQKQPKPSKAQQQANREAMLEQGLVFYQGQWRHLLTVAHMKAEADSIKRARRLKAAIQYQVQRLGSRSSKVRSSASQELLALAKREGLKDLPVKVRRLSREVEGYWRQVRAQESALVEVRLQNANLTRLRRFTTSLGTGSPVTLELPEVRRVSIGSTVLVPLGR